jgi:NAD/NADP transhydrogenase alpha subunit
MNPAVLIASSLRFRAGRLSGLPGDQPRAASAAYAAHVGDQRHFWHIFDRLAGARRGEHYPLPAHILGFVAVTTATVNVVGGFGITDRMLKMFGKRKQEKKQGAK